MWSLSDSDNEEEENTYSYDSESSDSDILKILSSLICNLWKKSKLHIKTDFSVTGWLLCIITHIRKDAKYHSDSDHRKQVNNVIKTFFLGYMKMKWLLLKTHFGLGTLDLITRMVHFMVMNLFGKAKTSEMVTVICGIKNIHFLVLMFLVFNNVESYKRFLLLVQQIVLGVM